MYRTIPIRAKFTEEEKAYWIDQCQNANSLINCAIYYTIQNHYQWREKQPNAFSVYWRNDELRCGWKLYKCCTTYPELDKALKLNLHYKALAAQSAQQTLKSVGESIKSYNSLVDAYYQGDVNRPSLPRYRKKGGLAAVTFPRQALTDKDGCSRPSISKETKPELITQIELPLPEFIDSDWVKEVTIRPSLGEFWIDWVIDDGKQPIKVNPNLDYSQAYGFDHGGTNWLTGASGSQLINADCNGAANILKKVATQLGVDLAKVGRGSLTLPKRYDLFSNLKRSYREKCEALRFQASA